MAKAEICPLMEPQARDLHQTGCKPKFTPQHSVRDKTYEPLTGKEVLPWMVVHLPGSWLSCTEETRHFIVRTTPLPHGSSAKRFTVSANHILFGQADAVRIAHRYPAQEAAKAAVGGRHRSGKTDPKKSWRHLSQTLEHSWFLETNLFGLVLNLASSTTDKSLWIPLGEECILSDTAAGVWESPPASFPHLQWCMVEGAGMWSSSQDQIRSTSAWAVQFLVPFWWLMYATASWQ